MAKSHENNGGRRTEFARVLGWLSAVCIVSLLVSGLRFDFIAPTLDKLFGGKKQRWDLHCKLSYFTLFVAIVHMIAFWQLKDGLLFDRSDAVIGYIALVAMILVAVNGIRKEDIIYVSGFKAWHRFHFFGSLFAIFMALVHISMR